MTATGLPFMIWGWAVYSGSTDRAEVGRGGVDDGLPYAGANTVPLAATDF